MQLVRTPGPFRLNDVLESRLPLPMASLLGPLVERVLSLSALEREYRQLPTANSAGEFARAALERLGTQFRLDPLDQARIPREGPLVVVANHPVGGLEGVFLIWLLSCHRDRFGVLGNEWLCRVPELAPNLIPVRLTGGRAAVQHNAVSLRAALRLLQDGGAVVAFPSGEVSALRLQAGTITDAPWSAAIVRLARMARATIVPLHFGATNSRAFQLAGLLHPALRTALLPRELLNKRRTVMDVRIGQPLPALPVGPATDADDERDMRRLRVLTYALELSGAARSEAPPAAIPPAPVIDAIDPGALAVELADLPAGMQLAAHGDLKVYCAPADDVPRTLTEIGRLRELTFRAVGEGTGQAVDLDAYDEYYSHLFIWDTRRCEVVGAYRVGMMDRIVAARGLRGLYTHSLFDYDARLLARLGPSLELGRSFVRAERQRSFAPLMLLWKGIGQWVLRNPSYASLFGPASIPATLDPACLELLVSYLGIRHRDARLSRLVAPRRRFVSRASRALRHELSGVESLDELEAVMRSLARGHAAVPVLLRQYLKLGAVVAGFNVDAAFADSIDCLLAVDLRRTNDNVLARYLGGDGVSDFRHFHRTAAVRRSAA